MKWIREPVMLIAWAMNKTEPLTKLCWALNVSNSNFSAEDVIKILSAYAWSCFKAGINKFAQVQYLMVFNGLIWCRM